MQHSNNIQDHALSVILAAPHTLEVRPIPVPSIPGDSVRVQMKACGICGSDVRYLEGENPWALHTLGENVPSPPNMVLGHEVSGVVASGDGREDRPQRRVAVLAYKGCGKCRYCLSGRENLCDTMEHFGHSAGWKEMDYYPGGMAEEFEIWKGFDKTIPDSISHEEAVFLDGLAVAVHAVRGCIPPDRPSRNGATGHHPTTSFQRVGVIGLGPIGLLAAQVARSYGAEVVFGCDTTELPVTLARKLDFSEMVRGRSTELLAHLNAKTWWKSGGGADLVIDTVGTEESIENGLSLLDKSGTLALLAVHEKPVAIRPVRLSGERRIVTSANNLYKDFDEAIDLLASGRVQVKPLITHRFSLKDAREAFAVMQNKEKEQAYKVVLHP